MRERWRTHPSLACAVLLALVLLGAGAPTRVVAQSTRPADPLAGATLTIQPPGGDAARYTLVRQAESVIAGGIQPVQEQPNFHVTYRELMAPASVHVHALFLPQVKDDPLAFGYRWDFGDPGSRFNTLEGFVAAHQYQQPGEYTITLTLTAADGSVTRHERTVRVVEDRRSPLYVSADGDDAADGTDASRPIRSWSRVRSLLAPSTRVMFRRGDVFDVPDSIRFGTTGVHFTSWGDASLPQPVLRFSGPLKYVAMFETTESMQSVIFSDLCFDSTYTQGTGKNGMPDAVRAAGVGVTIRDCTFLNVGYALNGNGLPRAVLVQDCVAPLPTGIRSYFAWVQGYDHVYVGNRVANSTREHVIRCNAIGRLLIAHNDFANLDRRPDDPHDTNKGSCVVQSGEYAWITGNTLHIGPAGLGPLADGDGLKNPGARFKVAVFEHNRVNTWLEINHGGSDFIVRNNVFRIDGTNAITVAGFSAQFNRGNRNVTIAGNTARNASDRGTFVKVQGKVEGLVLRDNVYLAPRLAPGSHGTAAVYVADDSLGSFSAIAGNVWPVGRPGNFAEGGVMYVWPRWADRAGYLDPAEWGALPGVTGDVFLDLPLESPSRQGRAGADETLLPPLPGASPTPSPPTSSR